jgi:hypothetical protein
MNQADKENLHKEIDLIQECIKRMANNSFLLKGWSISLVAVVLSLSEKDVSPYFLGLVVLVPLISFWYLDAFFLYTEKLYRKMYEWVIVERPKANIDKMYDLNPHRFKNDLKISKWNKKLQQTLDAGKNETVWTVMWSVTLRSFYFIPISLVVLVLALLLISQHQKSTSGKPVVPPSASQTSLKSDEHNATPQRPHNQQKLSVPGFGVGAGER